MTHKKSLSEHPSEEWREYDAGGNLTHTKRSAGGSTDEVWYTYNAQGKKSYERHSGSQQSWYEYDAHGNEVYQKSVTGIGRVIESCTEHTYWPNGTVRTRALYYPV